MFFHQAPLTLLVCSVRCQTSSRSCILVSIWRILATLPSGLVYSVSLLYLLFLLHRQLRNLALSQASFSHSVMCRIDLHPTLYVCRPLCLCPALSFLLWETSLSSFFLSCHSLSIYHTFPSRLHTCSRLAKIPQWYLISHLFCKLESCCLSIIQSIPASIHQLGFERSHWSHGLLCTYFLFTSSCRRIFDLVFIVPSNVLSGSYLFGSLDFYVPLVFFESGKCADAFKCSIHSWKMAFPQTQDCSWSTKECVIKRALFNNCLATEEVAKVEMVSFEVPKWVIYQVIGPQ